MPPRRRSSHAIQALCFDAADVPAAALMKMAKLGAVIDGWMRETDVAISAVQCWTSLEEYFGVVPCTVMSMMSNNLMSSACEVDICGRGRHACAAAGFGDAQRAARLEQQLRRRPEQGGLLPLQQSAEAFLRATSRWISRRSSRARWAS